MSEITIDRRRRRKAGGRMKQKFRKTKRIVDGRHDSRDWALRYVECQKSWANVGRHDETFPED